MKAEEKITSAKAALILDYPFFGSLALRLIFLKDETCQTMYTDGKRIGYNPDFVDNLTVEETKGTIAHEVMHCALLHMLRRNEKEPLK